MDHAIEEGPEEEVGEHLSKEPIGEQRLPGAKVFLPRATSLAREMLNHLINWNEDRPSRGQATRE